MITEKIIKNLKPQQKRYQISDGTGLVVYIQPQGKKVFYAEFRLKGTKVARKLGEFPSLRLSEARKFVENLKSGNTEFKEMITIQEAFNKLLLLMEYSCRESTIKVTTAIFNKNIAPYLGNVPVDKVTPILARNAFENIMHKNITLRISISLLNRILNWSVNAGYIEYNRCMHLAKTFPAAKIQHQRTVSYSNLFYVCKQIFTYKKIKIVKKLAILFIICSLLRKIEVISLKDTWIKDNVVLFPKEFTKTKREYRLPLTKLMQEIIKTVKRINGSEKESIFLENATVTGMRASLWRYTLKLTNQQQTLHGFRSMGRTWMADNGVNSDVAEACLMHVSNNQIVQTYQRSDFLQERFKVMEKWNNYVNAEFKKGVGMDIYTWLNTL